MKKRYLATAVAIMLLGGACSELVTVDVPKNQLTTDKVFGDSVGVKAALLNVYALLERQQYPTSNQYLSVYADEALSTLYEPWNQSAVSSSEIYIRGHWTHLYSMVYQSNALLEKLAASVLAESFVRQVRGEALYLRAYAYFYLVNCWGRVPLILNTDVNTGSKAVQSEPEAVYAQLVADLLEAREYLDGAYRGPGRVRANRAVATALLARVYLYRGEWALAEEMATELIGSGQYTPLEPLETVFMESSRGSILQLATENGFTEEASQIIPESTTSTPSIYFTAAFYQSFEPADRRKTVWIGTNEVPADGDVMVYHYPYKYKNNAPGAAEWENLVVLRIAEQYLIRAEARAQQDKLVGENGALADLNAIRLRAGLPPVEITDKMAVLEAIANERRHELFFENADRLFDLRRRGVLDEVMAAAKPTWVSTAIWLPIPLTETRTNPNLDQNDGYEQ